MPARIVSRPAETAAVADFLDSAATEPAALVVAGEAGIGKTTLWLAAAEQACERGFWVLSARAAAAESMLAYGSLADLLAEVDTRTWADLPDPWRRAMDRIMLHADEHEAPTDQRAVAAGFLSVVHGLAAQSPLLVALDDLQWLDASSRHVIAFATRRLLGRVGVLATVRTDPDGDGSSWGCNCLVPR